MEVPTPFVALCVSGGGAEESQMSGFGNRAPAHFTGGDRWAGVELPRGAWCCQVMADGKSALWNSGPALPGRTGGFRGTAPQPCALDRKALPHVCNCCSLGVHWPCMGVMVTRDAGSKCWAPRVRPCIGNWVRLVQVCTRRNVVHRKPVKRSASSGVP